MFFCLAQLRAQVEDSTMFDGYVVTAEIQPTKSSESVQNIRLISQKTIEKQGAVNLSDLLSKEMNIRVGNDNILGSSLSLQGISECR